MRSSLLLAILSIIPLLSGCADPRSDVDPPATAERTYQDSFGIRDFLVHDTLQSTDTGALFSVDTMRALVTGRQSGEELHYRFPIIRSTHRPEVARKVTQGIWSAVYGFDDDSTVFDGRVIEVGESGQTFLDFSIISQTSRLLVIRIMQEGCGAYCTYRESTYLYDLESGERIGLTDLVTPKGIDRFAREGYERAREKIVDYIAALRPMDPGVDSAAAAERIEFYSQCLESSYSRFEREEEIERLVDDEEWEHGRTFYILNDTLFLLRDDCSRHWNRAMADLGNLESAYGLRDIRSYLTAYGRRVLAVE